MLCHSSFSRAVQTSWFLTPPHMSTQSTFVIVFSKGRGRVLTATVKTQQRTYYRYFADDFIDSPAELVKDKMFSHCGHILDLVDEVKSSLPPQYPLSLMYKVRKRKNMITEGKAALCHLLKTRRIHTSKEQRELLLSQIETLMAEIDSLRHLIDTRRTSKRKKLRKAKLVTPEA